MRRIVVVVCMAAAALFAVYAAVRTTAPPNRGGQGIRVVRTEAADPPAGALERIARHQAATGPLEDVLTTVALIHDPKARDGALSRLARDCLDLDVRTHAERARQLALAIQDEDLRALELAEIAVRLADANDPRAPAALEEAKTAAITAQGSPVRSWFLRQWPLVLSGLGVLGAAIAGPLVTGTGKLLGYAVKKKPA